jgi:hypothetical protein
MLSNCTIFTDAYALQAADTVFGIPDDRVFVKQKMDFPDYIFRTRFYAVHLSCFFMVCLGAKIHIFYNKKQFGHKTIIIINCRTFARQKKYAI